MGNKTNHWIDTNTIGYVIILGKFTGFQFATHILLTRYLAIINGVNNSNSIAQSELTKNLIFTSVSVGYGFKISPKNSSKYFLKATG